MNYKKNFCYNMNWEDFQFTAGLVRKTKKGDLTPKYKTFNPRAFALEKKRVMEYLNKYRPLMRRITEISIA